MKLHFPEDTDSLVKGRGCMRLRNRNEAKEFRALHLSDALMEVELYDFMTV